MGVAPGSKIMEFTITTMLASRHSFLFLSRGYSHNDKLISGWQNRYPTRMPSGWKPNFPRSSGRMSHSGFWSNVLQESDSKTTEGTEEVTSPEGSSAAETAAASDPRANGGTRAFGVIAGGFHSMKSPTSPLDILLFCRTAASSRLLRRSRRCGPSKYL